MIYCLGPGAYWFSLSKHAKILWVIAIESRVEHGHSVGFKVLKFISVGGLLSFLIVLAPSSVRGQEIGAGEASTGVAGRSWAWLVREQEVMSRRVSLLAHEIDSWLAGERVSARRNESYLSMRVFQQASSLDGYHSRVRLGGRLDLPAFSERLKLVFDSDNREQNDLDENILEDSRSGGAVAGVRFEQLDQGRLRIDHDIGLRVRSSPDPYYRLRTRYGQDLGGDWALSLENRLWWFRRDGLGADLDLSFGKYLNDRDVLIFTNRFRYQDREALREFAQAVEFHRSLGLQETLSYELGYLGEDRNSTTKATDYYLRATYRKPLEGDWLFLDLSPQLVWEKELNWKTDFRLQLNLEVYFSDI